MPRSRASLLPLASNHHPTPAFRTMEDRDTARVPPLANVDTYWHALTAIERVTVPHAAQEQHEVQTFLDRKRRGVPVGDGVTAFHSTTLPAIAFADYATLVAERTGYGREGVAVGLALMARYAVATKRGITPLSVHRLFATCMQVGMKATSDKFLKNSRAAPVFGMSLAELNAMERALVREIDFELIPTLAEFTDLPAALAHHGANDAGRWDHTALYAVLASHNHQVRTVEDSVTPPTTTTPSTDARIMDSQRTSAAACDSGASYLPLSPKLSGTAASWTASLRVRVYRGARVPTPTISADADDQ